MERNTLSEGIKERQAPATGAPEATAAVIFGCAGTALTAEERAFFRDAAPWGFILFARNVDSPDQLKRLTAEMREAVGWRAPVLIDQEGGRVARLRAPHWRVWPAVGDWCAAADDGLLDEDALWELLALRYRLIAAELADIGVDVNCVPTLDLRIDGATDIVGDRALGREPETVAARGAVICQALEAGGVLPVLKHMPGHGRADVDSHEALPVVRTPRAVLECEDFAPFAALRDQALGMTAHIVYAEIDRQAPATLSPKVISEAIRGAIGFDGALMTDDLSMGALDMAGQDRGERGRGEQGRGEKGGGVAWRAASSLAAGCDLALHCNGDLAEMTDARGGVERLDGEARRRTETALARRGRAEPFDPDEAARLEAALAEAGLV